MFDNVSKFLAERYSNNFASWLLERDIPLTALSPTELNVEPIRADAIILLASEQVILHIEFQTQPDPKMPMRMADYYLRLFKKSPDREIAQVVIYLQTTDSPSVRVSQFVTPQLTHEFRVIRLWEVPVENFWGATGLLPYAVLAQTDERAQTLERVVMELERILDRSE